MQSESKEYLMIIYIYGIIMESFWTECTFLDHTCELSSKHNYTNTDNELAHTVIKGNKYPNRLMNLLLLYDTLKYFGIKQAVVVRLNTVYTFEYFHQIIVSMFILHSSCLGMHNQTSPT